MLLDGLDIFGVQLHLVPFIVFRAIGGAACSLWTLWRARWEEEAHPSLGHELALAGLRGRRGESSLEDGGAHGAQELALSKHGGRVVLGSFVLGRVFNNGRTAWKVRDEDDSIAAFNERRLLGQRRSDHLVIGERWVLPACKHPLT